MLEDRDYMRSQDSWGRRGILPIEFTAVQWLLAINIGVFVCDAILRSSGIDLDKYLALSVAGMKRGYVWQVLTFQFMHAGVMHLFLNMLALYFIGRMLEAGIGKREFLRLYLISGACGGLLQIGCSWLAPGHFGAAAVVGASAGVFGVVGAYAALYPYQKLTLLVFFVLPVSLKAKTLIYLEGAMALYGILFPEGHIAHAAHLGGMICGILYLRSRHGTGWQRSAGGTSMGGGTYTQWYSSPVRSFKVYGGEALNGRDSGKERPQDRVIDVEVDDDFIEKKVDPILDKITKHGIQSLSAEEREILERAHKRIKKD